METQKIIDKLKELRALFETLKAQHHSKGEKDFDSYRELLKRIIDRTYPEKDAKELKDKLAHKCWAISGEETDEYWQKFYLTKVELSLSIINTILEEYELFGFDDFKPVKEKVETEVQIGSDKIGFWRRKKTK